MTLMKSRTVPVIFVESLLANAIKQDMDIMPLLDKAGIPRNLLSNNKNRVSLAMFAKLSRATYKAMQDESSGYYPSPQKLGTFSVMVRYAAGGNNLQQAAERVIEFNSILNTGMTLSLVDINQQHVAIRVHTDPEMNYTSWIYESLFIILHRTLCWLTGTHFMLQQVNMDFSAPSYVEEYHFLFGCPVSFDKKHTEFIFKRKDLNLGVNKNEDALDTYLARAPFDLLHMPRNEKSYAEKVRRCVKSNLPNVPEYERIAELLNIHPQTLRRRLKREGCDYRQIRNELIRDMALSHLRRDELEIKQISYALGFSEPSAFIRSFKRWTGTTPNQYRKKNKES